MSAAVKAPMKPFSVIKAFFFDGKASVAEMTKAVSGFSRPLQDDPDYRWIVDEAARVMGASVDWPPA